LILMKFLADVEDMVRCEKGQCDVELDIPFVTDSAISEQQGTQVCQSIIKFLTDKARVNGLWSCAVSLSTKRAVDYIAAVVYSETEENGFDSETETDFTFSCWKMQQASDDLESAVEDEFSSWELNTHDAKHLLDYFDRNYQCDGGYCSIDFILSFSISDPAALSSSDAQESVCDSIEAFYSIQAEIKGEWDCTVSPRPTKDDPNRFYATMTYSEGSRGLSSAAKAGIIVGCLLILLLLIIIIIVYVVQSQSKSNADYV